ncbi:hypothetical protein GA0115233_10154 [Streptomyces sp. DI166]|uniref:hypothetical protein n=1 Tax=Streptomyces sp. DI166 TaxID=1839783 RepID=UPI0007F488C7|nr:hypothetical protein [Streptomyces sp. DI166]SBT90052.1 hypothetical protein GA0115233_10154 [Streptomyces sp. DI166]
MRRARGRRVGVGVAVAAAALLGGCGIQESDVIEAGGPATIDAFVNSRSDELLFFTTPDGRLHPVIRYGELFVPGEPEPVRAPTEDVVVDLLLGPRKEDLAAGLTTALPDKFEGKTEVGEPIDGRVAARLPLNVGPLDRVARQQLICSIAYSKDPKGAVEVELTGNDGVTVTDPCALTPGTADVGEPTSLRSSGS